MGDGRLACERWPLSGFSLLTSGVAGLALSWAVGVGAYFLLVNVDFVPPALRAAAGLHNPGGPVPALDFGIALIVVGVWQTVFFVVLRGWPVNLVGRRPLRLVAGNALVIGGGAATYLVLRELANLSPQGIGAACGCVISAGLVVALVFEGWPGALLRRLDARGRSPSSLPPRSRWGSTARWPGTPTASTGSGPPPTTG